MMVVCVCIVRIECPVLDVRGVGHAVGVPFLVSTFFVCDIGLCVCGVCIECPVLCVLCVGHEAAGRRCRARARSLRVIENVERAFEDVDS